jgi:hypothetical protein
MLLLVAGCATPPLEDMRSPSAQVSSFSGHPPGDTLPPGWQPWILSSFKRPTEYRLVSLHGATVMQADARASASGLIHPLALDPARQPLLSWRWKVDHPIKTADNTRKHLEDSPVRLVVSFDGDTGKLPAHERMFFNSVRVLTGQQLPYATLMYIWENRAPRGTVIPTLHTSRIRMIVAESGPEHLGAWRQVSRNVVEDFRRAFGEEPGRITAVGIMTDTDNTGGQAQAWYGDIMFGKAATTATANTTPPEPR